MALEAVVLTPCRGDGSLVDLFFSDDLVEQEAAKRLCHGCPARARCLQRSIDVGAVEGIWGGYDEMERRFYRRVFGDVVGAVVKPLPKAIVKRLRANKVMKTGPDVIEAAEA